MSAAPELTVLIPTLNEGSHLAGVLARARAAVSELTSSFEFLVIDGGSRDDTVAAAEAAGARVARQRGKGFGAAIREGLELSRGRWVLAMDADGSHPVRYFKELWQRRESSDLVIASRFVPGGGGEMPWHRYWLSYFLNLATRWLLDWPIKDSSSGLRLYRRAAVAGLPLSAEDFSIQQETLAHVLARGGRAEEIPFFYEPRLGGESKADIWLLARRYLRMLWVLKGVRGGRQAWAAAAAVAVLGAATGLCGLGWGLPGPARLSIFPDGQRLSPQTAARLADGWTRLYEGILRAHRQMSEEPANLFSGAQEFRSGWVLPPERLANSVRSMLLQTENPDEKKAFTNLSRMKPWRLQFKPLYIHYGGTFLYPLGAWLAAGAACGVVRLVPGVSHYLQRPEDMGRLFLWGRLYVLFFHWAGLMALFALGCRLKSWEVGLSAAVLFALCPLAVENAHLLKPYPFATFWVLAACLATLEALSGGRRGAYWAAGLCAGLAVGANLSLAGYALLPALAWLLRRWRGEASAGELAGALSACAAAGAVFVVFNPYLVFAFKDYAWELQGRSSPGQQWLGASLGRALAALPGAAAINMGGMAAALGAAGLIYALVPRAAARRLVALAALGGLVLIAAFFPIAMTTSGFRLLHTTAALACLLGAALLWDLPRAVRLACLAAIVLDSGLRAGVLLENMRRDCTPEATRAQAAAWIEERVPAGSRVGLLRYPEPAHTPAFPYSQYDLVVFTQPSDLAGRRLPDYLVVDEVARVTLGNWVDQRYEEAARFEPVSFWWAGGLERISFANAPFSIYRRRRA